MSCTRVDSECEIEKFCCRALPTSSSSPPRSQRFYHHHAKLSQGAASVEEMMMSCGLSFDTLKLISALSLNTYLIDRDYL